MHIESRMIVTIHDQTNQKQWTEELFSLGPEIAWSFDRAAAELFVRRITGMVLHIMDTDADILVRDDGSESRLMASRPLDLASERRAAKASLLAAMSPQDRALLEGP